MSIIRNAAMDRLQAILNRLRLGGLLPQEKALIDRQRGAARAALEAVASGRQDVAQALKPLDLSLVLIESSPNDPAIRLTYRIEPKTSGDSVLNFIVEGAKVIITSRAITPARQERGIDEFDVSDAIDAFALYLESVLEVPSA